jgi:RNA polymerase sigma-70 factor (ECF subfamily)
MSVDAETNRTPRTDIERVWHDRRAKMWRSLTAFSGDPDLASDAVAEAFAQALGRGDALRSPERWIWRAAFRIATRELAARRRTSDTPAEVVAIAAMPEPVVDLVAALRTLTPNQRMVAVLRLYADLPTDAVANVVGCSTATVRVHLMQARRRLRRLLEDTDERT